MPLRPRGPSNFRQRDLQTAIKAAREAGMEVVRVEIEGTKIVLIAGKRDADQDQGTQDEWQRRLLEQRKQKGGS